MHIPYKLCKTQFTKKRRPQRSPKTHSLSFYYSRIFTIMHAKDEQSVTQILQIFIPAQNNTSPFDFARLLICIHIKMTNMAPSSKSYVDKVSDYSGVNAYSCFKILIILEEAYLDKINILVLLC